MKCPFQWNEKTLFSGKEKRHIFRDCDGDCAAYVSEQTVGQFTIPARCRMLDYDKQKKMGAQAHGYEKPELFYGSSPCACLPRRKEPKE